MPDYDVGAVGLSSPPATAVIQAYRPAVSVRNNGVHDALAVGSLRIYSAGLLIFTTEIYSGVIAPGETAPAQGTLYWTPPALGRYQVIAYVTCINDQYEPNNNLAPCFVEVIKGEPEPPSPVPLHAAQHEEGGGDELNIDGLHGRATDAQTPLSHRDTHQAAGSDQLNVTGLPGVLAEGQPIADHHATHENDGGDEMNVDDLHGVLYNLQKPQVHANEAHDPNYATSTELSNHLSDTTDVHEVATNLEHVNAKGNKNGYCPLDDQAMVPAANLGPVTPTLHATSHENAGDDEISIAGLSGVAADAQNPVGHHTSHEPGGADEIAGVGYVAHKTKHENAGDDEISIAGLSGVAADAQNPVGHHTSHEPGGTDVIAGVGFVAHKTKHEDGGDDEISIAGLSGVAADAQTPKAHYSTHTFGNSDAFVHAAANHNNAEPVAVGVGVVPAEGASINTVRADHVHTSPGGLIEMTSPTSGGDGSTEVQLWAPTIPERDLTTGAHLRISGYGRINFGDAPFGITFTLRFGNIALPNTQIVAQCSLLVSETAPDPECPFYLEADIILRSASSVVGCMRVLRDGNLCDDPNEQVAIGTPLATTFDNNGPYYMQLSETSGVALGIEIFLDTCTVEVIHI